MTKRYTAKVKRIIDGDTIEVEIKKDYKRVIRFFGVDCPEKTQKYGIVAKDRLSELLYGKEIDVYPVKLGKYGREVSIVYVNGTSVAEIMLKEGLCFASGDNHKLATNYFRLQEKSRVEKKGMWKEGNIENPAYYRRRKKGMFENAKRMINKGSKNEEQEIKKENTEKKSIIQQLKDLLGEKIIDNKIQENETINKPVKKLTSKDLNISGDVLYEKLKIPRNKNKVS